MKTSATAKSSKENKIRTTSSNHAKHVKKTKLNISSSHYAPHQSEINTKTRNFNNSTLTSSTANVNHALSIPGETAGYKLFYKMTARFKPQCLREEITAMWGK